MSISVLNRPLVLSGNGGGGGSGQEASIIERTIVSISNSQISNIGNYAFANCYSLSFADFPACLSIGRSAFYQCSSLTSINFRRCENIGANAFFYCESLISVNFSYCKVVGSAAFATCHNLSSISFPICENIEYEAFGYCSSLTSASFPRCIIVSNAAFFDCRYLESIYFLGTSIPILGHKNAFDGTPMSTSSLLGYFGSIYVRASLLSQYQSATNWAVYSDRMVGLTDTEIEQLNS